MKEKLKINVTKPQYVQVSDITYAQVDSWYDHCRRDLKTRFNISGRYV